MSLNQIMTEAELYADYKGVYVPKSVFSPESLRYHEEFNFRKDDILIATYPKSGTPWMKEIAKPKVLYVLRHPKDVFTSAFHYYGMASFHEDPGTVDQFLEKFLNGKVMFGSWFDHVKGWIHAENQEHILYIFYEEMITNLQESVRKLSCFLDKTLSEEVIEKIANHCVFHNMKQNKMSNYSLVPAGILDQRKSEFLRKGIVGDWKNTLTVAQSNRFDAVYKEKMKDVSFKFIWN